MMNRNETEQKPEVLCIGKAIADCIIRGLDPTPVSKTGFRAEEISLQPGGEALNQTVILQKLGHRAAISCTVGNDPAGRLLRSVCENSEADLTFFRMEEQVRTPVTVMNVDVEGNRRSVTARAHAYHAHPEQQTDLMRFLEEDPDLKILSLASLFRTPFAEPEALLTLVRSAGKPGRRIWADTKLPGAGSGNRISGLTDLAEVLPYIDFITPNEDEACFYTGQEDPYEAARVFLASGVGNVIIKLGSRGSLFMNEREEIFVPAFRVDAIDATGAGDNYSAAFMAALLEGQDTETAMISATRTAAESTCYTGALGWALR